MIEGRGRGGLGTELLWRVWHASPPRGAVMVLHGLGEHSGRYGHLAGALRDRGLSVFSFDFRGHGGSGGPRGDVDFFPRFLEDLLFMEEVMGEEVGRGIPWALLGHSMGGLVALRRLQTVPDPYDAGVLSAPWLETAVPGWVGRLGSILGWVLPGLRLPSGLGAERLTRDPVMARAWREDPLVHTRVTARLFREARRAQEEVRRLAGRLGVPLLFLVPQDDPVVRSAATEAFAREGIRGEVRIERLDGARHEAFNDLGREAIFSRVGEWLVGRLCPESPSGPEPALP